MKRKRLCGGYTVERIAGTIEVVCARCGPSQLLTPAAAQIIARRLAGPLGRFEVDAPRDERLRLAELLEAAAADL